jgi:DNA-3-methyladenine glycosylase II
LRAARPSLGAIIERVGTHRLVITRDPFVSLVSSITQQQVSMTAAAAVFGRLRALCPRRRLTARAVLALDESALRGAGLSRQKTSYMRNVAAAFASRQLTPSKLRDMDDEEVITAVTRIKGVGRWTAEMLLIFCLERPDVWPIDDLGLRKAVQRFVGTPEPLDRQAMVDLARPWMPYRTYASWYLWRSLEGPLMPGVAL